MSEHANNLEPEGQMPDRPAWTAWPAVPASPPAVRTGDGMEALDLTLAAEAVVREAELYAAGYRRLTVDHGGPLTDQAATVLDDLMVAVLRVARSADGASCACRVRATSITWTFRPEPGSSARRAVLAARTEADRRNPGGWVITADSH